MDRVYIFAGFLGFRGMMGSLDNGEFRVEKNVLKIGFYIGCLQGLARVYGFVGFVYRVRGFCARVSSEALLMLLP